jgi:putative methyltransferase (TIGR04325 family)
MSDEIYFSGDYRSWTEAARLTTGYHQTEILESVLSAALAVKSGQALSQRDGVLLDKILYNFPLISTLLRAAIEHGGRLDVLDFGGSLGSTYFDSLSFIQMVSDVSWSIVEQAHFVAAGLEHLATKELHFFRSIDDYSQSHMPNVVVISGVLQYLSDPWKVLRHLTSLRSSYVFLDRTAFITTDLDRLTLQHISSGANKLSIPAWFLSEKKFLKLISESEYEVVTAFQALDHYALAGAEVSFKGLICKGV